MAFKPIGTLNPHGGPVFRSEILGNSITVVEEDSMKVSSGFLVLGTTGALVFGHVRGIVTNFGVGMETSGAAGAASGSFEGSFATASDNQTVNKFRSLTDISKFTMYSADPDGTVGTTTGSNLLGYMTDIADEDNTDETSAVTTTAQYFIWGLDPVDSTNHVVNIVESNVFGV